MLTKRNVWGAMQSGSLEGFDTSPIDVATTSSATEHVCLCRGAEADSVRRTCATLVARAPLITSDAAPPNDRDRVTGCFRRL